MKLIRLTILTVALAVLALPSTASVADTAEQAAPQTADDLFAQVAERTPAFGGFFLDENGDPTVYMVDVKQAPAAQAAIADVFGAEYLPAGDLRVLPGRYGFLQLKDWYDKMWPQVLAMDGAIFTDIDEANNRLHIGVQKDEARGAVKAELALSASPLRPSASSWPGRYNPPPHSGTANGRCTGVSRSPVLLTVSRAPSALTP